MSHAPTEEQQAILSFLSANPSASLLVDARAGAAKTSTIVMATTALTTPTLALAFNKRNQQDLESRISNPLVVCKTLNGLGHGAWSSRLGKRLTVDADKLYGIAKEKVTGADRFAETLNMVRKVKSAGLIPLGAPRAAPAPWPDSKESWVELGWQAGADVDTQMINEGREILLESIRQAFAGTIDFDDQIYMSTLFGGSFTKVHTVIVDESQDLSHLNHRMLKAVIGTRLIAIGDPHQAIYAFRGADANSMENMEETTGVSFARLGLTYSFRAPFSVSKRQLEWVPDFKSFATNCEGVVEHASSWPLSFIPLEGAVLCRNNAPLLTLAFALIKARRPVKILGRDIGASLATLLLKIAGKSKAALAQTCAEMLPKISQWAAKEREKVGDNQTKIGIILDRQECLTILLEASGSPTVGAAADFIKALFSDKGEALVLSSGHRSKGMEWPWVMHLDPWRLPSKYAVRAAERGEPGALVQENNLRYVIETRSQHTLVFANLKDCEELS